MTKEEIIEAISEDKTMPFIQTDHLANIVNFVIKNYHPSLPPNSDEAAEEYAYRGIPDILKPTFKPLADEVAKYFKAGVEWVVEQGVKLHGRILPGTYGNLYIESDYFDRGFGGLNYKFSDSNDVDIFVQVQKK